MRTWRRLAALALAALWLQPGCTSYKFVSLHEPERIARADTVTVTTRDRREIVLTDARVEGLVLVGRDEDAETRSLHADAIQSVLATDWSTTRLSVALVALGILAVAVGVGAGLLANETDGYDW